MNQKEELKRCQALSDAELIAEIRLRQLTPSIQALLERVEVKPEEPTRPDTPRKPTKICNYCGGIGISLLSRKTCPNCHGSGKE